jgi:hypothetical protein
MGEVRGPESTRLCRREVVLGFTGISNLIREQNWAYCYY